MRAFTVAAASLAALLTTTVPRSAQSSVPHKPMDIVATDRDVNGWPLNPDWFGQADRPHGTTSSPDIDASAACDRFHNGGGILRVAICTTQAPEVDERRPFRGIFPDLLGYVCRFAYDPREQLDPDSVHGHVNWMIATYTGTVSFDDYQNPAIGPKHLIPGDGDLDFTLQRADHRGYVAASALQDDPGIVLEVNRRELGQLETPWWSAFRKGFEEDTSFARPRSALKQAPAVAVGLLGIDTKHGAHTELHPLYALFAKTSAPGAVPEHWVFFARNWGYEGGCSMAEHRLGRDTVSVRLESSLVAPVFGNLAVSPEASGEQVRFESAPSAAVVRIQFPAPNRAPAVVGEFDLCTGQCPPRPVSHGDPPRSPSDS